MEKHFHDPQIIQLRISHLQAHVRESLMLLQQYEEAYRLEDDPRRRTRNWKNVQGLRDELQRHEAELAEITAQIEPSTAAHLSTELAGMEERLGNMIRDEGVKFRREIRSVFSDLDATVVGPIIDRLDAQQAEIVRAVIAEIDGGTAGRQSFEEALQEIRPLLAEVRLSGALSEERARQVEHVVSLVDDPKLDVTHRLRVAIPIIPLLLSYETSLDLKSGLNLRRLWNLLVKKVHHNEAQ